MTEPKQEQNKEIKKYGQQYDAPLNQDQFVDLEKGAIIERKDIPPMEAIKALAERYKIPISTPRSGCHFCYGRGYIGRELKTNAPIPCQCLFRNHDAKQKMANSQAAQAHAMNHDQRRKMKKTLAKMRNRPTPTTDKQPTFSNSEVAEIVGPKIDIFNSISGNSNG